MTTLVAVDLDRTLIYSRGAVERWGSGGRELVAVERYEDADSSWLTADAAAGLTDLAARAVLVPVTTRVPRQLQRVRLPGAPSRYAVAANGGVLLVDVREIWDHAATVCRPGWTRSLRNADDLFCYAVLERDKLPDGLLPEIAAWASARGWRMSLQGRKLYWVPETLTKSAAAAEVARRVGVSASPPTTTPTTLAAGDSLLDTDLLLWADRAVVARHGELAASGWSAPHVAVTTTEGVLAGEEIVRWLVEQVAQTETV